MNDFSLILSAQYGSAAPRSWLIVPPGDYDLDSPCILEGKPVQLDMRGVTFHVRQELKGPAFSFGFPDGSGSNNLNYGWTVLGGRVRWADDRGPEYAANNTTAFRIRNVRKGRLDDLAADGMGIGIEIVGDGYPCTGNRISLRDVRNCRTGLLDHSLSGGFSTYHVVNGGWFSQGSKPDLANHLYLDPGMNAGGTVFRDIYFQGVSAGACTIAVVASGQFYTFADCGYESDAHSKMPFKLGVGTAGCILRGYTCNNFDWLDANQGTTKNMVIR